MRLAVMLIAAALAPACSRTEAPPTAASAPPCALWGGRGFTLTARDQGGHGLQFRELSFDDGRGTLSVHDSDLFAADGNESKTPRVIEKSVTLSAADHEAVAKQLVAICPDAKAMAMQCAPGGCSSAEITPRSGTKVRLEDHITVGSLMGRLEPFFPELRQSR
jgi:hypothetical protein